MNQQEQELKEDVTRVVELACRTLSPNDASLLRWAAGVSEPSKKEQWREIMDCVTD